MDDRTAADAGQERPKSSGSARAAVDEPVPMGDNAWLMWALCRDGRFCYAGHRRYAQAYARPDETPVRVFVHAKVDGGYFGWLPAAEIVPRFIFDHWGLFSMCFPYGPRAEEEHGKGRIMRLSVGLHEEMPRS